MRNHTYMRKNWKARLVSGLLSLAMALSLLPAGVLTLPAHAKDWVSTGHDFSVDKDGVADVTFKMSASSDLGSWIMIVVPDVSTVSGGAPSLNNDSTQEGKNTLNGEWTNGSTLTTYLENMGVPMDYSYTATNLTESGKKWENNAVSFNDRQIPGGNFATVKAALANYYDASGHKVSERDDIPMIAFLWTGKGKWAMAQTVWSDVSPAVLTATTSISYTEGAASGAISLSTFNSAVKTKESFQITITNSGGESGYVMPPTAITCNNSAFANNAKKFVLKNKDGDAALVGTSIEVPAGGSVTFYVEADNTGMTTSAQNNFWAATVAFADGTISIPYYSASTQGTERGPLSVKWQISRNAALYKGDALTVTELKDGTPTQQSTPVVSYKNNVAAPDEVYTIKQCGWAAANVSKMKFELWGTLNDTGVSTKLAEGTQANNSITNINQTVKGDLTLKVTATDVTAVGEWTTNFRVNYNVGTSTSGGGTNTFFPITLVVELGEEPPAEPHTVKFNANNGKFSDNSASKELTTDADTKKLATSDINSVTGDNAPTRTGYKFAGWYTDATNGTQVTDFTGDYTSDTEYFAHWTAYKVTFDPNGGSLATPSGAASDGVYTTADGKLSETQIGYVTGTNKPTNSDNKKYFKGWGAADDATTTVTITKDTLHSKDTTYYAVWGDLYTITFKPNDTTASLASDSGSGEFLTTSSGKLSSVDAKKVTGDNKPTNTNTKKIFLGWGATADATEAVATTDEELAALVHTKDTEYFAIWGDLYTITYDANGATGGSAPSAQTQATYGGELTIAGAGDLKKTGYVFAGWEAEDGTSYSANTAITPIKNMTLKAVWAKTYAVIYNGNGGSVTTATDDKSGVGYLPGEKTTVSDQTPIRAGYTFVGWSTDVNKTANAWDSVNNGEDYTDGDELTFGSANITLYAVWSELPAIKGATPTAASEFKAGGTVALDKISLTGGAADLNASDVGGSGKVPVAKWYVGNGGNPTTGPSRKNELAAGPVSSITLPGATEIFENDDIWVYLGGNGTDVKTDGKWVKLGTIGAKSATLTIIPLYVPASGTATTTNPTSTNPSTVGGGSYKAGVDINVSTNYTGQDLTFYGWSTKNDGTLVNTLGSGDNERTIITSPVANTNNGSATVNMDAVNSEAVATTIYAVYKVNPTLKFTVAEASDADIKTVKVTRSRGNVTLGEAFGEYTVQENDTVIVTTTSDNHDPDGFDVTATVPDGEQESDYYEVVTSSKSSVVVKIKKAGVTITAKSKAKPPRLNLDPAAGAGTLLDDGTLKSGSGNYTAAKVTVTNKGGSTANIAANGVAITNDRFTVSTGSNIAPDGSIELTITPKVSLTDWEATTYSIPVTITYTDGDGKEYTATTVATFVVSKVTTYTGTVTVNKDGTQVGTAAKVKLDKLHTTATATTAGKVTYNDLEKGVAYTISVEYSGKTYTATEKLSDTNPNVTVDLYTLVLNAPNIAANKAALKQGSATENIKLTIPKVDSVTGDAAVTKSVPYANLGDSTNGQISKVLLKGTKLTVKAECTLNSGYSFDKWTSDDAGTTGVSSLASYPITLDAKTTLYAVMKKDANAVVTYMGNFDNAPHHGSTSYPIAVPSSQLVPVGKGVKLDSSTPKLPGYVFVGWSTVATRTATDFGKDASAKTDFAPGAQIAALNTTNVPGYDATENELTLHAIWKDATMDASNVAGDTGYYGQYYGKTPAFAVKLNGADTVTTEKLNYAFEPGAGKKTLPGGLGLNANTGEVYGTPYQIGDDQEANILITLADDYHDDDHKVKKAVTYTMTVGKATPTITGVAISGAAEGAAITSATYTVTVVGPRLKSDNGSNAATKNTPADDVWETYTDTIITTGAANGKTAGIGTSAITGANSSGTAVTKFVTGGDTVISATFEAAHAGIPASGALGDASKDFDACSGNKQDTVWKDTAEDANIKGTATFTPNTTYSMAVRLGSENQDSDYATSKNWDYKASGDKHAHEGYSVDDSGTNGAVTIGSGTTADSVAAKEFVLKNTGTGDLTELKFAFGNKTKPPFAFVTTPTATELATSGDGSSVTFAVKVNAANAAAKGTYQDTLTITSTEGNSVVIYLSFTVDEATTYKAQITTKFQTVANAYADTSVAAAAAKIAAANNANAVITLKPVGEGDNVVIDSSTPYDSTHNYYEVNLVSGKDYQVVITGTGADGANGYTLPGVTVTANNHTAEVTMHQVQLEQHFHGSGEKHIKFTNIANDPSPSGTVSGAGWYVNGQRATISTYTGFTSSDIGSAAANYTFVEWFSGKEASDTACTADAAGANSSFATPITAAKKFNAHYKVQDAATVTLTYDKNTNDDVLVPPAATATKDANGYFTISSIKPSRTGYIFKGWASAIGEKDATTGTGATADGATIYQPGANSTSTPKAPTTGDNRIVYAVWEKFTIGHTGDGNWTVAPPDGTYGVDYSYTIPGITVNAGKVTYKLVATTIGSGDDAETSLTKLPGGLELDAATGLIHGRPYEVIENKGPYVLKAEHELEDSVVTPLYSEPFYITVDKYQLQLTNTSVTGAVAGQGADTATYTATVVPAPIYKGKTDNVDVWGLTENGTPAAFTETVTRTKGTSDATKLGTLALNHAGTEADPVPTFSSDAAGTTVKLIYNPSTKDASKDGNNSKHADIYKPAKAEVKAGSGGSTYTMKVKEDNREAWATNHSGAVNEGTAITMWGPGASTHQGGFKAKEDYEHDASSSNAKWGTGETVSASGAKDKVNAQQFTLTNTGNQATKTLKYRFGSATSDNTAGKYFTFTAGTLNLTNGLGASGAASNGDKGTFLVIPKTGLPYQAEAYTDTLVITNSNGFSVTVTLSFKVTADDMSLKVVTYLWNKDNYKSSPSADEIAAAKKDLEDGQVELVNTANGKTITIPAADNNDGEYTFTQYPAEGEGDATNIGQGDSFYIKINGYTVTDTATGLPKVVSKADPSVGVYLYEVTSANDPAAGAAAVPTLANSASTGGISSTDGSIYVVHGETAKVTAADAAATYTYKELQDTTTTAAPNGTKATSGTSYTTAPVTAPKAYTAIYTRGYTLTYNPNQPSGDGAVKVKVGTAPQIDAVNVSSGHEPTDTVIAADPADLTTTKESTTYTGWTRAGYTFDHWNTKANGTGTKFAIGAGVELDAHDDSGTVTLYAIWRSATELTLEGAEITVAYKEAIDKDYGATGGQSGKEYTAKKGDTAVNTNTNAVPDIEFVDGGESGDNAEKFSFTGTSNDKPTGTDTEKTTTITVTVTDGNGDTKSADYTINQVKADTEIKKGFEDGVIAGTESNPAPKAGDDFDFTKLKAPNDMEVIAKKADGTENTAVKFAETPTNKNGSVTPGAGEENGQWSLTAIDGKPIGTGDGEEPAKFKEGEHTYTLTYTPTDPGFKPSTQTITIDLAKKIDKVVVSIAYPVSEVAPDATGAFLKDGDVHATASSPDAVKTDATVVSVSWPDGLDGAGKFDRSKDITVFVKVTPKTADGWKFDKDNFTAEFSDKTTDTDSSKPTDNVTATVISVTDTDAVLQYTWKAQDTAATNIRIQVNAPTNGGTVDKTYVIPVGTPAGSFTPEIVKWVKGNVNDTVDANTVTSTNYTDTMKFPALDPTKDADKVVPGSYVVIVTATANKGYFFNKYDAEKLKFYKEDGTTEKTDAELTEEEKAQRTAAANAMLANIDGKGEYAKVYNMNAKVLKVEETAEGRDKVTLAVAFTVEDSAITGLHTATGPLSYYVRTETNPATPTGDKHHDANATGNNSSYGFTLSKSDFTVTATNDKGESVTLTTNDFTLFVDNNNNKEYDAGDTILDTKNNENKYTGTFEFVHGTDVLTSAYDGKDLYAAYTKGGTPQGGTTKALKVGTLIVKPLEADKITNVSGFSIDAARKVTLTTPTADVSFNSGAAMVNTETVNYAVKGNAYGPNDYAEGTETTTKTRPNFYFMVEDDTSSVTITVNGQTKKVKELVSGDTVAVGKSVYACYTDVNGHLVATEVTSAREFSVTVTDENGPDPEYGDKLTAEPVGGKPKPDGTYDYVWEKWVPKDNKPGNADPTKPGAQGDWKPIPTDPEQPNGDKETGKTHTPYKEEVGEYIRVTVTDGDSNTVSSDPELIKPRSLNFTVKPHNKNYDRDANNEHEYVVANEDGSLDFTPTMVMKNDPDDDGNFVATTPYGGVVNGDDVKIGPSATANATNGWNSAETTRPAYATADVGAEITWPQVLATAADGKHATTADYYALSGTGYQVRKGGTDENPVMVAVYRLAPQDSQAHCGVIMGGAGDIIHVDVSFDEIPVEYHTIPVKPMGVTDSRETRPGESETTEADTDQNYKATWYTGANVSLFENFDPTDNNLPTGVTKVDTTTAPVFAPDQSYTVVVQVKPQPGKFYSLGNEAHKDDTQFFFHFGSKDPKKSVEVHSLAADPTRTDGIEVFKGLKVKSVEGKDDVYYMWYTFAVPDSGWVLPPHETNPWPDNMDFGTPVYYAQTAGHDTVNTTADNNTIPGGKKDVKFQFDLVSKFVTPINTAATPVEGTEYKPYQLTTDGTSTVTLTEDNYGTFWRLVAGTNTVTAKDNFLDNLTGWGDTTTTLAGKTFQDTNTNLTTQTAANADSVKLGDANIYVQINDKVGTVISTPLTTLNVRELTAEDINPVVPLSKAEQDAGKTKGERPVKLNYTAGDKFDVTTEPADITTSSYANITSANVDFKALRDGQKVSTYNTATVVDGIAKGTGSQYFFRYKTLDGDGNVQFVDLKSGADGTELTVAAHNGKPLYICYNDVNSDKSGTDEHTVRTRLGTLAVTEPGKTPDSTASIYIRNNTRSLADTQYGDELEAVVVGVSVADAATVSVKWQRLKKNATDETADASWEDIGHTDKKYLASKNDVLTKVRAVITAHTGHNVPAYPNSDSVEVAKKQLAVTWTWTPGSKVYDGNATAATGTNGANFTYAGPDGSAFADQLTHGQGETTDDVFDLTKVTNAVFANTATAPADNSADVGYNKPITLTGGDIPEGGGKINGTANPEKGQENARNWNDWYVLDPTAPKGNITPLTLGWDDFTFTGKVKRYDGTDHVYSKDNFSLTVENTDVADNVDLSTAAGADKDSGLWTLKNPKLSEDGDAKKYSDALYATIIAAIKATNVRYTTANSLEPQGKPIDDQTAGQMKADGHSTIILELTSTSGNIKLPTGTHYVKDAAGKTNSAINPKQVTVGPNTEQADNGVLTPQTISKTATTVTLPGTVQTAQVVTNDPTVNFTVLGKVEPHEESATEATVTVLDVEENTSKGIYWSDNNYALIWKNGDPVECPITGGKIEAITDVTIAQVVYGNGLSSVKVTAKVKYEGIDAPESTSDYTFATLANLGIKAIVEHDTNGDPATMEYNLADPTTAKAGWDKNANDQASVAVRFFLADDVVEDHLDTTFADAGNKKLGAGTITVLPRKLNVTPKWNLDTDPKVGKFYDGTANALGTLKDATDNTLATNATGAMTFTYDNWAFDADKTKVAVNTSTDDGYNAAFADKDAGDDKPITVTLVTDAPFTGDLSHRYEGEVKLAEGNIKPRPVTIALDRPSVRQHSDVNVNLHKEVTDAITGIMTDDSFHVYAQGKYISDTADPKMFDKTEIVGNFTGNVTITDGTVTWDDPNYKVTVKVEGGDVTALNDVPVKELFIDYYLPKKDGKPKDAQEYGDSNRVSVAVHVADNAATTQWYDDVTGKADFTNTSAMDFTSGKFDEKHYYMVQSVFTPTTGNSLSAATKVWIDRTLWVTANGTADSGAVDVSGDPTSGLLSAKAIFANGKITVQAIYYVPADEPAQVELVHITYPEPEANAAPKVAAKSDKWTWLNLADNDKVDVNEDPADPAPAAGSKKTKGTTWYKTNRGKPTTVRDFIPTAVAEDTTNSLPALDAMTPQNGTGVFDYDSYYMVEGVITPKKTPAPGYVFAGAVNVVVNDITVTVSDAGSVVANADDTGWAMAKWETKTVVDDNGTPDNTTDDTTSTVKTGNVIVRYIAKTAPAETKVIDRVLGKVTEPTLNGRIGKTVSETQAYFENETTATATPRVTYSQVKWYKTADPATAYTAVPDTENTFKAGQYYKAEFTVETKEDYKFLAKAMDTEHAANTNYVAFKINDIPDDDDFTAWINWDRADGTLEDSDTVADIKVTTLQTTGNTNKYTITVTFPMIDNKQKLDVEGFTVPTQPKAGDAISNANITAKADQPYEIETVGGNANRSWQHWNGTTWEPAADANFKAGHFYRAELTVKIKDAVDANGEKMTNLYKFTEATNGFVNDGKASGVPDGEKPDVNDLDTNIRYNKTGDEVTTVTLFKEFYVKREAVEARLYAREPKAGDWAYLIEDDIKIHASHKDNHYADTRYTLSDQGNTEPAAQWYYKADNGSYVLMDHDVPFQEGGTYFLITDAKALEGYCFADSLSSYKWFDSPAADAAARQDAALYVQGPNKVEGEVTSSRVAFKFELPPPNYINVIPGNAKQPVYDQPLDDKGWTSENFNVVGKVTWYEGEKKIGDIDSSTPVDYTNAKEETVYTAAITVEPKDGVTIDPDTSKLIYTFNGERCETDEYRANPDGTYTLVHTFPPTGKKEVIHDGTGSGGGGGISTVESPVVYYHLKDQGVTDDPTAEKVRKNSKPTKVPKVKAITGLKFLGWSEVDPGTLPAGKLPTLVDPTTFKITADKWFYAVYEQGPEVDHLHYVIGFPNGTFGPDAKITRAEVATIIARSCLEGFVEGANYGNPGNYSDVTTHWAFSAIAFCAREGVFKGYEDGTFRPDRYITRQELATVVARLAGIQTSQGVPFNDKAQIASWAMNGVYTAYANGWIKGYEDGTFQPERDISRAETVKIFNGYLKRGVDAKGLEGLKEYVHTGVASNNTENGHDEYMTWPDVPKTHWAYHEIIEAANDHNYHWQDAEKKMPPEDWDEVYIEEKWRYNDNASDGADKRDENMNLQKTFTVTYLVSSNGVTYDAITETVDRFASPKPENMPIAVPNEGYRFAGWSSTDPSTGEITLVDPTASGVTSDKWFYAVFEEDKPTVLPVYTVTYVIGDLGSYDGATVERVEMYQAPSVSGLPQPEANEGYRFAGWSETDPATGSYTIVDPTANYVTGDKTFYAVYEKADEPYHLPVYTVTYVIGANGSYDGETVEQVEMYQAPSLDVYPHPVANEGYRFVGWSETDPATGSYSIMDPTANYVTGDKTFYAVYEEA